MKAKELKQKFLEFFKEKNHKIITSASLIPKEDPSVLFTTAGMHPLIPYLMGEKHPLGKRLANVQKCIRTGDIDDVGDDVHLTFFEMLGNWSLGDYWKEEAIKWSYEFLISKKWLNLDPKRLHVSIFKGDKEVERDNESTQVWLKVGIPKERIYYFSRKDNFWGPVGETGPCGPDSEIFYDTGKKKCSKNCKPGCSCGKYFEVWNDVFMEYNKTKNGYEKLKQRNVDTGMGVERTAAMLQEKESVYEIETFKPIVEKIKKLSKKESEKSVRIITDHLKAAVFILAERIIPSNLDQGYILRKLIRRAIRHGKLIGINNNFCSEIGKIVIEIYKDEYNELEKNKDFIFDELNKEENKFKGTLEKGLREFDKLTSKVKKISGRDAFMLFSSYGFPLEMIQEIGREKNIKVDVKGFEKEFKKHQELSRKGAEKKFKGGLVERNVQTARLHTATHLLHAALRKILSKNIMQKGSNITPERLRFDFNFDRRLTNQELKKIENLVNEKIRENLEVKKEEMKLEEARKKGAIASFDERYGEKVSVYSIGNFTKDVCAGPHAKNTKELGNFKIIKEESIAAGVRRIKAILI